jgi:hypothetical protein
MSASEPACSGDSLKEDNKSGLSLSSSKDSNNEKASNLSTKENNKNVGMTLRSVKKDKEHPSACDYMRAEKVMEGEPEKGQPLGLSKRHPGKSQQPNGDSDSEVEPGSSFRYTIILSIPSIQSESN